MNCATRCYLWMIFRKCQVRKYIFIVALYKNTDDQDKFLTESGSTKLNTGLPYQTKTQQQLISTSTTPICYNSLTTFTLTPSVSDLDLVDVLMLAVVPLSNILSFELLTGFFYQIVSSWLQNLPEIVHFVPVVLKFPLCIFLTQTQCILSYLDVQLAPFL